MKPKIAVKLTADIGMTPQPHSQSGLRIRISPTWRSHIVRTASSARSTTILPTALYFLMKKSNLFQIRRAVIVAADFLLNLNFF